MGQYIIPLIERWNLRAYVEPLIHSGRNEGNSELDLTPEQHAKFAKYYVRQDCIRVRWKMVVSSTGEMTPSISIRPEDFARGLGLTQIDQRLTLKSAASLRDKEGKMKDLFEIRFIHPLFAKPLARLTYEKGCVCEAFFTNPQLRKEIANAVECGSLEKGLEAFKRTDKNPLERLRRKQKL